MSRRDLPGGEGVGLINIYPGLAMLSGAKHLRGLEDWIDSVVALHDGPAKEIPLSLRRGDFVRKRLEEMK